MLTLCCNLDFNIFSNIDISHFGDYLNTLIFCLGVRKVLKHDGNLYVLLKIIQRTGCGGELWESFSLAGLARCLT